MEKFDALKMYCGKRYSVNDYITINQPTIGDIIDMGEQEYYGMLSAFTAIPSDLKAQLWDKGIDWMEISDFDLFCMLVRSVKPEQSKIFFGADLDFTKFELFLNPQNNMLVLQGPPPENVRISYCILYIYNISFFI